MAKIILLCGKVCSGKSTYAEVLSKSINAIVLSCDELMLTLFGQQLGDAHREMLNKTKKYLYELTERIIHTGVNVILDFGFWSRAERKEVKKRFDENSICCEMHYLEVSNDIWESNITKRNELITKGNVQAYFIDDALKDYLLNQFEEPDEDEIDIIPPF